MRANGGNGSVIPKSGSLTGSSQGRSRRLRWSWKSRRQTERSSARRTEPSSLSGSTRRGQRFSAARGDRGLQRISCAGMPSTFAWGGGAHLEPLKGEDLYRVPATGQPSASLDGFVTRDLKCIAHWAPQVLEDMALLLNVVECDGKWPTSTIRAAITLIKKFRGVPKPFAMRSSTVLSTWYRTYPATATWQECCVPAKSHASRAGSSAKDLALRVTFDNIDRGVMEAVLRHRCLMGGLKRGIEGMYARLGAHFGLGGC